MINLVDGSRFLHSLSLDNLSVWLSLIPAIARSPMTQCMFKHDSYLQCCQHYATLAGLIFKISETPPTDWKDELEEFRRLQVCYYFLELRSKYSFGWVGA